MRPLLAVLLLLALGVSACGEDDESEISDQIERAVTTKDVKVECEDTVTKGFVSRVYGDVAQCRRAERPEAGEEDPTDVKVSDVEVDGDSATARVEFVGGDTAGARGTLELRKEDGDWRIDELGVDLLRSTFERGLASSSEDEALGRPEVRRCASRAFADLSDAELRRVAYATVSERPNANAVLGRILAPCLTEAGSGAGDDQDVSFLREKFEEGVSRNLRRRGASRARIDCINRSLRRAVGDGEILAAAGSGAATARLRRLAQAAAQACR